VGGLIGWLIYLLSPPYRERLRTNAARAALTPAQRRASIGQAGRMAGEMPWLWLRAHDRPLGSLVQWDDTIAIDQAVAAGKGLVLLTPHLGCFEVLAMSYAERWGRDAPLTALYRPARQTWLRQWQETARTRPGMRTAPATMAGVRQMLRALRRGETLGLLPDQVPPEGLGIWVPFFGADAYTMTLAAKLLQQTGAAWSLLWAERLPGGRGWRAHVHVPSPLPELPEAGEDERLAACVAAINREMEMLIRRVPEQYLWGYNRYKQPRRLETPT
jgi:KDO2-lipid IV(A) lauroyltransferase